MQSLQPSPSPLSHASPISTMLLVLQMSEQTDFPLIIGHLYPGATLQETHPSSFPLSQASGDYIISFPQTWRIKVF